MHDVGVILRRVSRCFGVAAVPAFMQKWYSIITGLLDDYWWLTDIACYDYQNEEPSEVE